MSRLSPCGDRADLVRVVRDDLRPLGVDHPATAGILRTSLALLEAADAQAVHSDAVRGGVPIRTGEITQDGALTPLSLDLGHLLLTPEVHESVGCSSPHTSLTTYSGRALTSR